MYNKVTPTITQKLEEIVGKENVSCSKEVLANYAKDESLEPPHFPEVVVRPDTTEEVSKILKLASTEKIPVTPQGSRTGLSGAAHPAFGGIALCLERMNRILEIDEENLMATVQPGVLVMDLHAETEKRGLLYPPDPGEESGSLGGNISTSAGGIRGLKYGVTRDYTQGLEVVLASGEVIRLGGKFIKNSTGYELIDLFIGSEGTLGVVTEAIVRLVPKPTHAMVAYVPFNSTREAARAVSELIRRRAMPYMVEFLPQHAVLTIESYLKKRLPAHDHQAYLLVGVEGRSQAEVDASLETLATILSELGAQDAYVADTPARQQELIQARKSLFDAYKSVSEIDEVDMCIPRSHLPDYIEGCDRVMKKHGVTIVSVGHAGDGNIHSNILRGSMDSDTWHKTLNAVIEELIDLGLSLGGTVSGEHGLGSAKKDYLIKKVGIVQLELMRSVKRAFDPLNILNPGKVPGILQ